MTESRVVGGPDSKWADIMEDLVDIPFPDVEIEGDIQWLVKPDDPPIGSKGARVASALFRGAAPVRYTWEIPYDEVIVLIEGEGTIKIGDGPEQEMQVGASSFVPKGTTVTYDFKAPFKELFLIFL